jgi:hypothetical protein
VAEIAFIDRQKGRVRLLRKWDEGYEVEEVQSGPVRFETVEGFVLQAEWLFGDPLPDEFVILDTFNLSFNSTQNGNLHMSSLKVFKDDEKGYKDWLSDNPKGFILNVHHDLSKIHALHTRNCHLINKTDSINPEPFTGGKYLKVCCNNIDEIYNWVKNNNLPHPKMACNCLKT